MYIGMITIAVSGLIIGCLYCLGLKSGILIETIISWHEFSVSSVYWLVGLHLIGAIYQLASKFHRQIKLQNPNGIS